MQLVFLWKNRCHFTTCLIYKIIQLYCTDRLFISVQKLSCYGQYNLVKNHGRLTVMSLKGCMLLIGPNFYRKIRRPAIFVHG